jgi:NNP family nitrate/nitrite transporter-like MFS transporter
MFQARGFRQMTVNEDATTNTVTPWKGALPSLFLLTAIFFFNFISRIALAPLMPNVEEDLNLGHGGAGSFFLLISFGYCVGLLGSGFISRHLKHRWTIFLSAAAVCGVLIAIASSRSLLWIRFWLSALGLATGIYLPSGIATLTALVQARDWGKSIAVHELAPNSAFVVAPLITETLLKWCSWREILAYLGVSSLLIGLSFLCFGRGGQLRGEAPNPRNLRLLLTEPGFWILVLFFALGIGGSLGVYNMLPLYLVSELGIERSWANTLIAVSRVSCLGVVFLAGWLTDRFGPRIALFMIFLGTGVLTVLLGSASGSWIVPIVFLQAALAVSFFPAGFAALSMALTPRMRNVAVSLTVPAGSLLGGGAVPAAIGILGGKGYFATGFVLVGALILTGMFLVHYLKIK